MGALKKAEKRPQQQAELSDSKSLAFKREKTNSSTLPINSIEEDFEQAKRPRRRGIKRENESKDVAKAETTLNWTELVNGAEKRFNKNHAHPTAKSRDRLWTGWTQHANLLRQKIDYEILKSSLTERELEGIRLHRTSTLLPNLVQSDGKLRVRKRQEKPKTMPNKAISAHLQKIEKTAHDSLFLMAYKENAQPEIITQARMYTRLLELPNSERAMSCQEHNGITDDYEFYLGPIAEKVMLDLLFFILQRKDSWKSL